MPVPRRQFVQTLGLGVLGLAMPPLPRWLEGSDEYRADALGFRFRLPARWRFVAAADIDRARAEGTLPGGEAAKEAVLAMAGFPLVAATRDPIPERGPTAVVWRQAASGGDHAGEDHQGFALVHELTYCDYGRYLRDFRVLERARAVEFAGRPASRVVIQFAEDNVRGEAWTVRLESHMLRWRDSWLTFNFVDLLDGWDRQAREDFAALRQSIEFLSPDPPAA